MPEPTRLDIENTLQGKSLYLHKRKKQTNDMLVDEVLCLPQSKICKINMVKGRSELFKSSVLVRNTELGKNKSVEKTRARHGPTRNSR